MAEPIDFSDIEEKSVLIEFQGLFSDYYYCRYHVEYDDSLEHAVIVDGVPIIDNSKLDKLLSKITKTWQKQGVSIKQDKIFLPWDKSANKSKGSVLLCKHPFLPKFLRVLTQIHVCRV